MIIICIFDFSVLYLLSASVDKALFSIQALFPIFIVSANSSLALAALNIESRKRTSLIPKSSKTDIKFPPFFSTFPKPSKNLINALDASFSHASAKSFADIPAILAYFSTPSNPSAAEASIWIINLEKADPPISASIPTDDKAAAKPTISDSVIPTVDPAPASLIAIETISASVVALLFPKATIEEPNLSKSFWDIPVILANLAKESAASFADKFVASPKSIIVFVNDNTFSVFIPNCPAASATEFISVVVAGISVASFLIPFRNSASSSSVASTVFSTPIKESSKSIAVLTDAVKAPPITKENFDIFFPASSITLPASLNFLA